MAVRHALTMDTRKILKKWHTHGALWLMEEPDLITQHLHAFLQAIAKCDDTEPQQILLLDMAGHASAQIRAQAAGNPHLPDVWLQKLASDKADAVCTAVAQNPRITQARLDAQTMIQAMDADALHTTALSVLSGVSGLSASSHHHWHYSYWHDSVQDTMRRSIVQHPQTLPETLALFVHDDAWWIRYAITKHPHVNINILKVLANDPHSDVRIAVLQHPSFADFVDTSVLAAYARDTHVDVRKAVLSVLLVLSSYVQTHTKQIEIVEILARDSCDAIRIAVAQFADLSQDTLAFLAKDPCEDVRVALAKAIHTPEPILIALMQDDAISVRDAVAQNPQLLKLAEQARQLISTHTNTDISFYLTHWHSMIRMALAQNQGLNLQDIQDINGLAQDTCEDVRKAVAQNPQIPPAILDLLAHDPSWVVRKAVVQNAQTEKQTLAYLANDPAAWVRLMATKHANYQE